MPTPDGRLPQKRGRWIIGCRRESIRQVQRARCRAHASQGHCCYFDGARQLVENMTTLERWKEDESKIHNNWDSIVPSCKWNRSRRLAKYRFCDFRYDSSAQLVFSNFSSTGGSVFYRPKVGRQPRKIGWRVTRKNGCKGRFFVFLLLESTIHP